MSRLQTNAAVEESSAVPGHEFSNPDNKKGSADPLIFGLSVGFIGVFVLATIIFKGRAREFFSAIAGWLLSNLNWMYIGGVSISFLFLIGIFVSHFGRMRLGGDGEQPEHSTASWFAMLFAGGIGSVLMFFGVAEPLNHVTNVPMQDTQPLSREAIREAMGFTMYHFGVHMWVISALPGLAMGYFIYKRHLPPRISSIFAPILGAKIYSWPGKLIDALAIIGTVFGIAVSVGLGALQINAGLAKLFGAPTVAWVQVAVIAVICVIACFSVASGLNKGIKILSNANILMAVVLMIFILATGPTLVLLRGSMDTASIYADYLPKIMFWSDSQDVNPGWQGKWTVFYWAWTICWSPFVGMFVARISRGRTVREFIGGVLALPTIFSIVWFSVFGFAGLDIEQNQPGALTDRVVQEQDTAFALFGFLEHFPWVFPVSVFALIIVAIFFITSIDSAAMITDMFSAGEENKTPTLYRVLWALLIGAVAGAILVMAPEDGISTLQEVVIIIGFPFFVINFVMMYSLLRGMHDDYAARPEPVTRQWGRTDSAEKLEEHESRPAPGYDEEGNELPRFEFDEDGSLVIPGNVRIQGNLGVDGDVDEDPEPVKDKPQYNQDGDLVDDEGRLINDEGELIDEDGNRVDENGVPLDEDDQQIKPVADDRN
ncbi:BCCT family transporter [Corynebacterium auriscanis]|uniref:Multidrug DMT transporter permease n=1 Tax=Corynebacterium auriscanis TaxID=99807 RepID=A0A0A2DIR3_9CORY|nr:BCCT family transporter [Corynebacterium auriscanis]KGM19085.1 multidrug DMT transporter permease [Corynebacterium auriscanis]WJY72347.1 Glycine betaine transporter OpuD [Corynebacterium auriscanis]